MHELGSADIVLFEGFRLDRRSGGLFRLDDAGVATAVTLGSRSRDLLRLLVERPGELVSKDAIMDSVWPGTAVEEANLTVQIAALRRILDHDRERGSCIQTVPGRGYRFVAPVNLVDAAAPPTADLPCVHGSEGPTGECGNPHHPEIRSANEQGDRSWAWRGIIAGLLIGLGLLTGVVAAWNWHSSSPGDGPPAPRLSIVVLPFADLSDDWKQQYFADGITDDLTTDLSRIAGMFVISRNTAFTYRNKPIDAKQIGRELGVRYLLEGSVRRSGNQVRINAELIDTKTGAHLWAERFDRDLGDVLALQNEITTRVSLALRVELISAEAARPTEQPDVLEYILRGRALAFGRRPGRDVYAERIGMFERALALDPRSAAAQSWLAITLATRVLDELTDSAVADISRAERLIGQAQAISPGSPLVHWAKGQVLRAQGRCEEAIPEYEISIASNHNVGLIAALGECKFYTGSTEEMIPLQEQAIRLSPHDPFIANWYHRIGIVHLLQSRTDEAIHWFEKERSANPGRAPSHAYLASSYALEGETERAAAELTEARRLSGDNRYSSIARLKIAQYWGVPKVRELFEATYFVGLRKAGMPDE
jgi:TolB-like protein/DNA-binding winged helix-turn-helix (wHTH) protein/Tfp pilus assembly protein PilF